MEKPKIENPFPSLLSKDIKESSRILFGREMLDGHLDLLFGGKRHPGVIAGGSYLIAGDSNAGKTTATIQMANILAGLGHEVMYYGHEMIESEYYDVMKRVGAKNHFGLLASDSGNDNVSLTDIITGADQGGFDSSPDQLILYKFAKLAQVINEERETYNEKAREANELADIRERARRINPALQPLPRYQYSNKRAVVFIDSLQSISDGLRDALDFLRRLDRLNKMLGGLAFVINQVTKGGSFAGSNKMLHAVTAYLHLKVITNENGDQTRCWEMRKNRAGPCDYLYTQLTENGHKWIDKSEVE